MLNTGRVSASQCVHREKKILLYREDISPNVMNDWIDGQSQMLNPGEIRLQLLHRYDKNKPPRVKLKITQT